MDTSGKSAATTGELSAVPFDFDKVARDEDAYILERRKAISEEAKVFGDGSAAGLALSGGGIRSAAFCIGAMQALEAFPHTDALPDRKSGKPGPALGLFSRLDYLSSVSGGGYAASCVSASVAATGNFPFPSRLNKDEPAILRHIRDHSNYLFPRGFMRGLGPNLTVFLRGLIGHLPFFIALVLFLVIITVLSNPTFESLNQPDFFGIPLPHFSGNFVFSGFVLTAAIIAIYAWSFIESAKVSTALNPKAWQNRLSGIGFLIVVAAAFLEFQPYMIDALRKVEDSGAPPSSFADVLYAAKRTLAEWTGFFGGVAEAPAARSAPSTILEMIIALVQRATIPLTALAGFIAAIKGVLGSGEPGTEPTGIKGIILSIANKSLVWLAGLAVPLLFWVAYLYLCYWAITPQNASGDAAIRHMPQSLQSFVKWVADTRMFSDKPGEVLGNIYVYVAMIFAILSLFQRPNANSAHILYKERLAAAFLVKEGAGEIPEENRLTMKDLGGTSGNKATPLHLINAALNIQGSEYANSRGRDADFFTISQLHTGSEATKYARTDAAPSDLDQATAMAASAAAASTAMGSNKIGLLGFTLAFLNVRLGYWLRNPGRWHRDLKEPAPDRWAFLRQSPYNYMRHEIFGQLNEQYPQIYLTDGGHIENLGLCSLLKRRCKFIIVLDAEADPEMRFPSFAIAQRYARIDLGVRIDISTQMIARQASETRMQLNRTGVPGKDSQTGAFPPRQNGPHCAIGRIFYPPKEGDGDDGILLYVKSSMSGDENDYVNDYARRYRAFPHETTGDQFFSEEQFECYRALGFHALNGALRCKDKVEFPDPGDAPATLSQTIGAQADMIEKMQTILGPLQPRPDK